LNSKRLQKGLISLIVITIILGIAYLLGWSSALTVKKIEITGSDSQKVIVLQLEKNNLALVNEMKLARVDIRAIKRVIGDLDWLAQAQVDRSWFKRSINIEVVEKVAVARAVTSDQKVINFDQNGGSFTPVSNKQVRSSQKLPLISSDSNSAEDYAAVAKFLQELPDDSMALIADLIGLSVGESGYISMKTQINNRMVNINWGEPTLISQKSRTLQALLLLPENKSAKNFDLSLPDSPVTS
jgi:cell division protein FtsQ